MTLDSFALKARKVQRPPFSAALLFAFLALCLLSPLTQAQAQNKSLKPVILQNDFQSAYLGPHSLIQKDPQNLLSPQSIEEQAGKNLNGQLIDGNIIDLKNNGDNYWIATRILNKSESDLFVIDFGGKFGGRKGNVEKIAIYEILIPEKKDNSNPAPVKVNPITDSPKSGAYNFRIKKNEQKLLIINIQSKKKPSTSIPLKIHTQQSFLKDHEKESALKYTLLFLLLSSIALTTVASILKKQKNYLAHTLYFLIITFLFFTLFWMNAGVANAYISITMLFYPCLLSMAAIFLCKYHYEDENSSEFLKYIFTTLILFNICLAFLLFFAPTEKLYQPYIGHFSLLITYLCLCGLCFAQDFDKNFKNQTMGLSFVLLIASYIVSEINLSENQFIHALFWYAFPIQAALILNQLNKFKSTGLIDSSDLIGASEENHFSKMREAKDGADHSRLLKVIEKEREALFEFREKEAVRMKEMEKAKEEADEANRAKSAFLAVVSHEIRTPMTGIMGMVKLLLSSNLNKQQHDYAMTIQESSDAMLALLNDILDFEKIQRGKLDIENISFDLHRIIHGVVNLMSGHATDKKITLTARMDDDIPRFVKGDPTRLRQILLNLMGNAIKFTQQGGVTLYVKNMNAVGGPEDFNVSKKFNIYFGIQDTGIGISPEAQKNLFNPFSQADSSISRKFGGTGLGLAISKGLIEKMGSTININSNEGEGTTFFFTLSMEKGLSTTSSSATTQTEGFGKTNAHNDIRPLNILLVDDNDITRKVVSGFLQDGQHTISHLTNAEDALALIHQKSFDVVFMDIELPGISGNEAVRRLREYSDKVKANTPVFALTGNVGTEYLERYLADGMTGFIAKPIDPEKLKDVIRYISAKTYEREIKAPGASVPQTFQDDDIEEDSFALAIRNANSVQSGNDVFNPDMLQSLKDTIGADPLNSLLEELLTKTDEILSSMQKAVEDNDLNDLAARAHELKGMAGNFGLVEVSSIAAQAEKKAKEKNPDGLFDLVSSLPAASNRAKEILKEWASF